MAPGMAQPAEPQTILQEPSRKVNAAREDMRCLMSRLPTSPTPAPVSAFNGFAPQGVASVFEFPPLVPR